jgi:hypothetical protein
MLKLLQKMEIDLDEPVGIRDVPKPLTNIKAIKIRWLFYQTSAVGEKVMKMRIGEIRGSGMKLNKDKSNAPYFMSIPLDLNEFVTIGYANFTDEMDVVFDRPLDTLSQLNFEILINDTIANQISVSNPLSFEIAFYGEY